MENFFIMSGKLGVLPIFKWLSLILLIIAIIWGFISNFDFFSKRFKSNIKRTQNYIIKEFENLFINLDGKKVLYVMSSLSIILGGSVAYIVSKANKPIGIMLGLVIAAIIWKIPKFFISFYKKNRTTKFVNQMVDALTLMANAMRAGLNVPQALQICVDQMPNPISQEFALVLSQNKVGVKLEDAFENLAKRIISDDVDMFATSVNILKETGGNLAETFETIVITIRERIKLQGKISAMVSQGLTQGTIVFCMPFALALVLWQVDPEMMRPMFTTPLGWAMVGIMLIFQIVGGVVILAIVKIKI